MNLEQLCLKILKNPTKLKDPAQTILFLKYHFDLLRRKRKKLKLGKVAIEVKTYFVGEIPVFEELEMIFVRQDNTREDELKIENRLKALD